MQNPTPYRVLMAAGGTGGHVYPAIAIANSISEQVKGSEIRFAGTRTHMEWSAVPAAGYPIDPIWISGLHRRLTPQNLLFPIKLIVSLFQSWRILRRFRPNVVICCGGYVSGPIGRVAGWMGIPLMLQEQNSYPGVTNRMLGKHATRVFTAFDEAAAWFSEEKIRLTGNPVRADISGGDRVKAAKALNLDPSRKTLLIMGGSGGSSPINKAVEKHLHALHNLAGLQIIWQCGNRFIDDIRSRIEEKEWPDVRLTGFMDDMPGVYALSNLIVCRAGAGTLAELAITGSPSVLVPSPWVAGNHQAKNANSFTKKGAAVLLQEHELEEQLHTVVTALIHDDDALKRMNKACKELGRPDAASAIASEIIQLTQPETSKS